MSSLHLLLSLNELARLDPTSFTKLNCCHPMIDYDYKNDIKDLNSNVFKCKKKDILWACIQNEFIHLNKYNALYFLRKNTITFKCITQFLYWIFMLHTVSNLLFFTILYDLYLTNHNIFLEVYTISVYSKSSRIKLVAQRCLMCVKFLCDSCASLKCLT